MHPIPFTVSLQKQQQCRVDRVLALSCMHEIQLAGRTDERTYRRLAPCSVQGKATGRSIGRPFGLQRRRRRTSELEY